MDFKDRNQNGVCMSKTAKFPCPLQQFGFLVCLVLNHFSLCYLFLFNTVVAPYQACYPQGLNLLGNGAWILSAVKAQ